METLIELFDKRPLENILGAEIFRPGRIVYICPEIVARDAVLHKKIRAYFSRRALQAEIIFFKTSYAIINSIIQIIKYGCNPTMCKC